jgi:hypothetical protein
MTTQIADLIGFSEIADLFGVDKNTVSNWRRRSDFPAPVHELRMGPLWDRNQILEWRRPLTRIMLGIELKCPKGCQAPMHTGIFDVPGKDGEGQRDPHRGSIGTFCASCLSDGPTYRLMIADHPFELGQRVLQVVETTTPDLPEEDA